MPLSRRCGARRVGRWGACVNVAPEGLPGSGRADLGVGVAGEHKRPYLAPLPQAASPGVASLGSPC